MAINYEICCWIVVWNDGKVGRTSVPAWKRSTTSLSDPSHYVKIKMPCSSAVFILDGLGLVSRVGQTHKQNLNHFFLFFQEKYKGMKEIQLSADNIGGEFKTRSRVQIGLLFAVCWVRNTRPFLWFWVIRDAERERITRSVFNGRMHFGRTQKWSVTFHIYCTVFITRRGWMDEKRYQENQIEP